MILQSEVNKVKTLTRQKLEKNTHDSQMRYKASAYMKGYQLLINMVAELQNVMVYKLYFYVVIALEFIVW